MNKRLTSSTAPFPQKGQGFLVACLLFFLLGAVLILTQEKGFAVVWLNQWHSPWLDLFFSYYTVVGDGFFYILLIMGLFFWKRKAAFLGLICFAASGLSVQALKKLIFADVPRPLSYFSTDAPLHFVEGVSVHAMQSFPSGHTTTAFSCFCLLALLLHSKAWGLCFFVLALLAGISRMYLVQHFFEDIYAGAWLGTLLTWGIYVAFAKRVMGEVC